MKRSRTLTRQEVRSMRAIICSMGYLLDNFDKIQQTSFYRQEVKMRGNSFLKDLMALETQMQQPDQPGGLVDPMVIVQFEFFYKFFDSMLEIAFAITDLPQKKQDMFHRHFGKLLEKFNLRPVGVEESPLLTSPT